jgi:hypothetical protein
VSVNSRQAGVATGINSVPDAQRFAQAIAPAQLTHQDIGVEQDPERVPSYQVNANTDDVASAFWAYMVGPGVAPTGTTVWTTGEGIGGFTLAAPGAGSILQQLYGAGTPAAPAANSVLWGAGQYPGSSLGPYLYAYSWGTTATSVINIIGPTSYGIGSGSFMDDLFDLVNGKAPASSNTWTNALGYGGPTNAGNRTVGDAQGLTYANYGAWFLGLATATTWTAAEKNIVLDVMIQAMEALNELAVLVTDLKAHGRIT